MTLIKSPSQVVLVSSKVGDPEPVVRVVEYYLHGNFESKMSSPLTPSVFFSNRDSVRLPLITSPLFFGTD